VEVLLFLQLLNMSVKYPDSFEKIISQLALVSTRGIRYNNNLLENCEQIIISPSFWRNYVCPSQCGGCCFAFSLDYIPSEARPNAAKERCVDVNGTQKKIFSIWPSTKIKWCAYVDRCTGLCKIHKLRPLSCKIEPIKIRKIKQVVYIMKGPYGRSWQLKRITDGGPVLCDFVEFDKVQLLENDVIVFNQLLEWALYLDIDTCIPIIIDLLFEYDKIDFTKPLIISNSVTNLF